jgi:hypothetical protein
MRMKKTAQSMKDSMEYESRVKDAYLHGNSWAEDTGDDDDNLEHDTMNEITSFMSGHRQAHTHGIHMKKDEGVIIPNFVGGSLPRCD